MRTATWNTQGFATLSTHFCGGRHGQAVRQPHGAAAAGHAPAIEPHPHVARVGGGALQARQHVARRQPPHLSEARLPSQHASASSRGRRDGVGCRGIGRRGERERCQACVACRLWAVPLHQRSLVHADAVHQHVKSFASIAG